MYKITKELALYLIDNSKDLNIPDIDEKSETPFLIRNFNSIGAINPLLVTGMDCRYLVELDSSEFGYPQATEVSGFWLYRRDELKKLSEPFEIPRAQVDRHFTDLEAVLDISDCVIELPSSIDKLTCTHVSSMERLLELEPGIKDCVEKES
jgi:hypothetical protein